MLTDKQKTLKENSLFLSDPKNYKAENSANIVMNPLQDLSQTAKKFMLKDNFAVTKLVNSIL